MAAEAEVVEARLGARLKIGAGTAVAADAGRSASGVGEIVVAADAVDLTVLVVRKVEHEALRATYERLAQSETAAGGEERSERKDADAHDPEQQG